MADIPIAPFEAAPDSAEILLLETASEHQHTEQSSAFTFANVKSNFTGLEGRPVSSKTLLTGFPDKGLTSQFPSIAAEEKKIPASTLNCVDEPIDLNSRELQVAASLALIKSKIRDHFNSGDTSLLKSFELDDRSEIGNFVPLTIDELERQLLQIDERDKSLFQKYPLVPTINRPLLELLSRLFSLTRPTVFREASWKRALAFVDLLELPRTDPYYDKEGNFRNWSWQYVNKWASDPLHDYLYQVHRYWNAPFELYREILNFRSDFLTELATERIYSWEEGFCPRELAISFRKTGRVRLRRFIIKGDPKHPEYRLWWIIMETFHRMKVAWEMVRNVLTDYGGPRQISPDFEAAAKDLFGEGKYEVEPQSTRRDLLEGFMKEPHIMQFLVHLTQMNMLRHEADDDGKIDLSTVKHVTAEKLNENHRQQEYHNKLPRLGLMSKLASQYGKGLKDELDSNYYQATVTDDDSTISQEMSATPSTVEELARVEGIEQDAKVRDHQNEILESALAEVDLAGLEKTSTKLTKSQIKNRRRKISKQTKKATPISPLGNNPPAGITQNSLVTHGSDEVDKTQHDEKETRKMDDFYNRGEENSNQKIDVPKCEVEDVKITRLDAAKADPQDVRIHQVKNEEPERLDQGFTMVKKGKRKEKPTRNVTATGVTAPRTLLPELRTISKIQRAADKPAIDLREADFPKLQPAVVQKPSVGIRKAKIEKSDINQKSSPRSVNNALSDVSSKSRAHPPPSKALEPSKNSEKPTTRTQKVEYFHGSNLKHGKPQRQGMKESMAAPTSEVVPITAYKIALDTREAVSIQPCIGRTKKLTQKESETKESPEGVVEAIEQSGFECREISSEKACIETFSFQKVETEDANIGMAKAVEVQEIHTPSSTRASSQIRHKSMDAGTEGRDVELEDMTAVKNRLMKQSSPPSLNKVREQKESEKKQRRDSLEFIRSRASSRAASLEKPEIRSEEDHLANLVNALRAQVDKGKEHTSKEVTTDSQSYQQPAPKVMMPNMPPVHITQCEQAQVSQPITERIDLPPDNYRSSKQNMQICEPGYERMTGKSLAPVFTGPGQEMAPHAPLTSQGTFTRPTDTSFEVHSTENGAHGFSDVHSSFTADSSVNSHLGGSREVRQLYLPAVATGSTDPRLGIGHHHGNHTVGGYYNSGLETQSMITGHFAGPNVSHAQSTPYRPQPGLNTGGGYYGHQAAPQVYDRNISRPPPGFDTGLAPSVIQPRHHDARQYNFSSSASSFPTQHPPQPRNMRGHQGLGHVYPRTVPYNFEQPLNFPSLSQNHLSLKAGFEPGHQQPTFATPAAEVAHQVEQLEAEERALAAREDAAIRARKEALMARKKDVEELERQTSLLTPPRYSGPQRGDQNALECRIAPPSYTVNVNSRGSKSNNSPRRGKSHHLSRGSDTFPLIDTHGKPRHNTSNRSGSLNISQAAASMHGIVDGYCNQFDFDSNGMETTVIEQPLPRTGSTSAVLSLTETSEPHIREMNMSFSSRKEAISTAVATSADDFSISNATTSPIVAYSAAGLTTDEKTGTDGSIDPQTVTVTEEITTELPIVNAERNIEESSGDKTAVTTSTVFTSGSTTADTGGLDGTMDAVQNIPPPNNSSEQIRNMGEPTEPTQENHIWKCGFCPKVLVNSSDDSKTWVFCPGCGPRVSVRYCSNVHLLADTEQHYDVCGTPQAGFTITSDSVSTHIEAVNPSYMNAPQRASCAENSKHSLELFRQMAYLNILYSNNIDRAVFEDYVEIINKLAVKVQGNHNLNCAGIPIVQTDTVDYILFAEETSGQCHKILLYVYFDSEYRVRFRRVLVAAMATYKQSFVQFIHGVVISFIYIAGALEEREKLISHFSRQLSLEFPDVVVGTPPIIDFRVGGRGPFFDFDLEYRRLEGELELVADKLPELRMWGA